METKDTTLYFIYSEDGKQYIMTCYGLEELSYFLNRQSWRVKKDLETIKRKRKWENKLIKHKNGSKYVILGQNDLIIGR